MSTWSPLPRGGPRSRAAVRGRWPDGGWCATGSRSAGWLLFILIVVVSFAAPLYADHIAHVNPFQNNLNGHTFVNGKRVPLMQQGGGILHLGETPIGPTWDAHHYFLGADQNGRDVASRVLYGGRSSLEVGIGSADHLLHPRHRLRAPGRVPRRLAGRSGLADRWT